ncbi:hypothetical protein [Streptomyces sp. NPDC057794]|uniref:hypothetical protein n=1 Tax=Streptomyces sp. NPDC057794 TaxID=3346251 RepID=UPI0036B07F37
MKRRTLPTLAALTATAALLLTACGSGDDKPGDNERTAGADRGAQMPEESRKPSAAQAEAKPDGVDVSLPKDVNVVFDWNRPKDESEAEAMDDAANFFRAIYRGVDKRTTRDAAVATYATGDGLHYADAQINAWIDGGWAATGTLRHYGVTTRSAPNGKTVEVAFCADSREFYGKEITSRKILRTEPSLEDFDYYEIVMVKVPTGHDLWQASKVFVETKAAKCQ